MIQLLALLCPWLIENPQVASIAKQYLHFVAFGVPGLVYMTLFRFISEGHSLLKPIILTYLILLFCDALLLCGIGQGHWFYF